MHRVEIHIRGNIDEEWAEWFGGLTIHHFESGKTILSGYLSDQQALYGVIARLRDLGFQLHSINCEFMDDNECKQEDHDERRL